MAPKAKTKTEPATPEKVEKRCITKDCDAAAVVKRIEQSKKALQAASLKAVRDGCDPGSEEYEKALRPARDKLEADQVFVKRALAAYAAKHESGELTDEEFHSAAELARTLVKRPQWIRDRIQAERAAAEAAAKDAEGEGGE